MRIWWYIASQYLKTVLNILLFSLGIYFIITYMEESQHYFDGYEVSNKIKFLYYFWQIPGITIQLMPFAVLIGGILTNWMLAKHGEISALRAAGLSMMKISIPLIFVGFFFTLAQFMISELILPVSSTHYQRIRKVDVERKENEVVFTESTWLKAKGTVLHFEKYNEQKQELFNVEYFKWENQSSLKQIVHAKSGYFDENIGNWVLRNAIVTNFDISSSISKTEVKPIYVTNVDFAPPKVLNQSSESNQLSYWQLNKIIEDAQAAGTNVSDRIVDLYFKLSSPFANLLFVFLTIPFALRKERQEEKYIGIVICLVTALVYWFGNLALRSFAIKGSLNPLLAAWIMNILVIFLSYMLIRKLDKGQ
ncbi:LptF/LptG family permease [Silvanigrella sp.]|jgi:lipopolysaccharide export system permease protein|uniref:LptF/LptG family permease n=1 Tax=Silvanigrella sp. TaxID=2024976 RepID=UPI0037CB0936